MKHLALLLVLLISTSAFAAKKKHRKPKKKHRVEAVNMDLQFEVNGALIASPHVAVNLGDKGTITEKASDNSVYTIEVTPTRPKEGQVQMAFEVSRMIGGRKEVLGAPRILSLVGEKARVEQKGDDGRTISLEVTAKM